MIVKLILQQGRRRQTLELDRPVSVLGRARGVTVRLPSAEVSRQHCCLKVRDGFVVVEDLHSSNGTFLNGRPVKGPEAVRPGDSLRVGPAIFAVDYDLTPAARGRLEEFENAFEVVLDESEPGEVVEVEEEDAALAEALEGVVEVLGEDEGVVEVVRRNPERDESPAPRAEPLRPADEFPTERKAPLLGEDDRLQLPDSGDLRGLLEQLGNSADEPGPK